MLLRRQADKKNVSQFTSHDVNFRCKCPAHSQAFSGPLYIGQNGKRLQTSTAPSTDYAFEVRTPSQGAEAESNKIVLDKKKTVPA